MRTIDTATGDKENDQVSSESETVLATDTRSAVTPLTMARFLLGQKSAVEVIYNCPKSLWLGAVLVLSAGFAREYDGEDLASEPWHVFIPHVASLATSIILYVMLRGPAVFKHGRSGLQHVIRDYPRFLSLYWMTAPLAWLYAIPFERWLEAGSATRTNLYLLGIVSVWRVALITRSAAIAYKVESFWPVLFTVLLFGDAVMLAAIRFVPVPIFQIMGGIRLTESEFVILATTVFLQLAGYPMLLALLALYLTTLPPTQINLTPTELGQRSLCVAVSKSAWMFAILSVVAWVFVLPFTQPEQQLRRQVESAIARGEIQVALDIMKAHQQDDFPPHWSPPPYVAFSSQSIGLAEMMEFVLADESTSWVKEVYLEKFFRKLPDVINYRGNLGSPQAFAFLEVLRRLTVEDWQDNENWHSESVGQIIRSMAYDDDLELPEEVRQDLEAIIKLLEESSATDSQDTDEQSGIDRDGAQEEGAPDNDDAE